MGPNAATWLVFGVGIVVLAIASIPAITARERTRRGRTAGLCIATGGGFLGLGFVGTVLLAPLTVASFLAGSSFVVVGQLLRYTDQD